MFTRKALMLLIYIIKTPKKGTCDKKNTQNSEEALYLQRKGNLWDKIKIATLIHAWCDRRWRWCAIRIFTRDWDHFGRTFVKSWCFVISRPSRQSKKQQPRLEYRKYTLLLLKRFFYIVFSNPVRRVRVGPKKNTTNNNIATTVARLLQLFVGDSVRQGGWPIPK